MGHARISHVIPASKSAIEFVVHDYDREAEAVLDRRDDIWIARIDWETMVESERGPD